jgi:hypothetical protein
MDVLSLDHTPCCHGSLPYITGFDIKVFHQRIQTSRSHASCCRYYNLDFVLFHNVTCYTYSLLSCIHVNTLKLLLVAIRMILWSSGMWLCGATADTKKTWFERDWITCPNYDRYSRFNSQHNKRHMYDHLANTRIFVLMLNKIFVWALDIMRRVVKTSIWISYPSRTKHVFYILEEVGYLEKVTL